VIRIKNNITKGLVVFEVSENVSKQDLLDALEELSQYSISIRNIKIIQIDKGAKPTFKPIENINLAFAAKKYFYLFDSIKFAFVTLKSMNMAFFILAITSIINKRFKAKVFSSEKEAEEWLFFE